MEMTLFEISKKAIFPQMFQNPPNCINMELAWVFTINKNIIQIDNDKYI